MIGSQSTTSKLTKQNLEHIEDLFLDAVVKTVQVKPVTTGTTDYISAAYSKITTEKTLYKQAKSHIKKIFRENRCALYYSDLLEMTPYDLNTIIRICTELAREKKIKRVK